MKNKKKEYKFQDKSSQN